MSPLYCGGDCGSNMGRGLSLLSNKLLSSVPYLIVSVISGILFGFINLFIGMLEILSHFIRIISFTFRLFGNMTAGEILILVVCFLVPLIATIPFYGLELLVGFLQAMIFAGLTLVFGVIAMSSHAEEETEHTS